MSNFVKVRDGLIVDTDRICFIEPFDNGCRINFDGGSSICITIKEHDLLLSYLKKIIVYAVIFEEREHFQIDSEFFDKNMRQIKSMRLFAFKVRFDGGPFDGLSGGLTLIAALIQLFPIVLSVAFSYFYHCCLAF